MSTVQIEEVNSAVQVEAAAPVVHFVVVIKECTGNVSLPYAVDVAKMVEGEPNLKVNTNAMIPLVISYEDKPVRHQITKTGKIIARGANLEEITAVFEMMKPIYEKYSAPIPPPNEKKPKKPKEPKAEGETEEEKPKRKRAPAKPKAPKAEGEVEGEPKPKRVRVKKEKVPKAEGEATEEKPKKKRAPKKKKVVASTESEDENVVVKEQTEAVASSSEDDASVDLDVGYLTGDFADEGVSTQVEEEDE